MFGRQTKKPDKIRLQHDKKIEIITKWSIHCSNQHCISRNTKHTNFIPNGVWMWNLADTYRNTRPDNWMAGIFVFLFLCFCFCVLFASIYHSPNRNGKKLVLSKPQNMPGHRGNAGRYTYHTEQTNPCRMVCDLECWSSRENQLNVTCYGMARGNINVVLLRLMTLNFVCFAKIPILRCMYSIYMMTVCRWMILQ